MFLKKISTVLQDTKQIKSTLIEYNIKKKFNLQIQNFSKIRLKNYFTEIIYQTSKHIYLKTEND